MYLREHAVKKEPSSSIPLPSQGNTNSIALPSVNRIAAPMPYSSPHVLVNYNAMNNPHVAAPGYGTPTPNDAMMRNYQVKRNSYSNLQPMNTVARTPSNSSLSSLQSDNTKRARQSPSQNMNLMYNKVGGPQVFQQPVSPIMPNHAMKPYPQNGGTPLQTAAQALKPQMVSIPPKPSPSMPQQPMPQYGGEIAE